LSKNGGVEIIFENGPAGESQCNGVAENVIKAIQASVRKLKNQLETNMAAIIEKNSPTWPWLICRPSGAYFQRTPN